MLYKVKRKDDAEALRKMKQGKYGINTPDGGGEKKHWSMLWMHNAVSQ